MRESKIRWGIIGSGKVTQRFAQGVEAVPNAEVAAVWGRNQTTATALAKTCGATCAASLDELLQLSLDAVYIGTLPDTHAIYSIAALQSGKAVLCEKPVAINLAALDQVLAVAEEQNLLFMEAMKPPFFPVYRKLVEHLQQDPIGPIRFVRSGFSTVTPPEHESWERSTGGGSLMGIGVYHAFLAQAWLGEIVQQQTIGRISVGGVDTFAAVTTKHANGGIAQLFSGIDLPTPGDATLSGPLGYVTLHENWWNPERITITYRDGRKVELHEPFVAGGFNYETAHFCDLLRSGAKESPIVPHAASRRIMSLVDEARRSLLVQTSR